MSREIGLRVALYFLVPVLICAAEENKATTEISEPELSKRVPLDGYSFDIYRRPVEGPWPFEYTFKVAKGEKMLYSFSDTTGQYATRHDRMTAYVEVVAQNLLYTPNKTQKMAGVDQQQLYDFDGDGKGDVVVVTNTGGQGCCCEFCVFRLTPSFKFLGEVHKKTT